MKKLYLFDFDGTLTHKDTMFLYLGFFNRKKFRIQFLKFIPLFILVKLKLAEAEGIKKNFIASILKGQTKKKLEDKAQLFFETTYPEIIRKTALEFIMQIDKETTESFLVTASLDIWVKPFAKQLGMKLLATEALFENDIFTGDFKTPNCNGLEKLVRIKNEIADGKFDKKVAFGDTEGDRPMLNFADESYYRFFH